MLIDNLTVADMSFSLFVRGLWCLIVVWSPSHFGVLCDFLDVFKSLGWM